MLEIGSSYGFFLEAARSDGWQPTGIELDAAAATYGRQKMGLKIHSGTLESELTRLEPPYDAIVMFHVIEHVREPILLLQHCRKLLRTGGVLILKTPNIASWIARKTGAYWVWLSPPAHVHLFSPETLGLALRSCGFLMEDIHSQKGDASNNLFELARATGKYLVSRGKEHGKGGNGRRTWSDRWQVNAARALSDVIYYPLSLVVDPWLDKIGMQPELVAIARR